MLELLNEEEEADIPPILFHSIGKEMYKVGLNTLGSKNKRQRTSLMKTAFNLFSKSSDKNFKHSFYYLAEMYEKGDSPEGTNLKKAIAAYQKGAEFEDPRCLFQLALL